MITIATCSRCTRDYFPFPLLCAGCGGAEFVLTEIHEGTIEQLTRVVNPQPAVLASIRVSADVVVAAALQSSDDREPGSRIAVTAVAGIAGTAYVPAGRSEETHK